MCVLYTQPSVSHISGSLFDRTTEMWAEVFLILLMCKAHVGMVKKNCSEDNIFSLYHDSQECYHSLQLSMRDQVYKCYQRTLIHIVHTKFVKAIVVKILQFSHLS